MRRPLVRLSGLAVPIGAAVGALLLSAGPAAAGTGYGQLIVNPGTVVPGQSVSILGTCPNNGMGLNGVFSPAFVGGSASIRQGSINFSGTATIDSAASGKYTVTADCGTGSPSVTITVSGTASGSTTQPVATTQPPASLGPSGAAQGTAMMPPVSSTSAAAIVGGTTPAKPRSASAMPNGAAMTSAPALTPSSNGPVTSTGIVRVGLAGSSHSALTTTGAAAIALAVVLAGGVGFLVIRRRRNTPGSHI